MGLSNDERGWVMTGLSGLACIFGASFICIDIIVRQFPGKKGWKIQDSDVFLSTSLSLSFGVMIFSALYSMLPSAKSSLMKGGYDAKAASWIMVGCFLGGIAGIQLISRVMHSYISHNVVDCEHSHDDRADHKESRNEDHKHPHSNPEHRTTDLPQSKPVKKHSQREQHASNHSASCLHKHSQTLPHVSTAGSEPNMESSKVPVNTTEQRPTLQSRITAGVSKLAVGKVPSCECDGPCYGYSDLCQQNCFKTVTAAGGVKVPKSTAGIHRPAATKSVTTTESTPLLHGITEEPLTRRHTRALGEGGADVHDDSDCVDGPSVDSSATVALEGNLHKACSQSSNTLASIEDEAEHHHHHVPTNAFLNIGLQTSIAIALHKLPEGFITYATNHANPELGVSVFLALFIHNITEGFAMALPLYLAINNRLKAMLVSFILGGLSQPLGAGVAAIWFKLAGNSNWAPSESGYGAMFAITAGIMASVGLQLFAESLDLTHSKYLCFIGAFIGMGILGISSALTA